MNQPESRLRLALLRWYRRHGRDLPWRRTRDPYAILVSEIMLQQTTVATVQPRYEDWLRRFPSILALAAAPENDVLHAWQGLGYYARARNLHRCAQTVARDFHGAMPKRVAELQKLPGLGRYTANAVAVFAFGQTGPLVEANTARVLSRLHNMRQPIDSTAGREKLWQLSAALAPSRSARHFQNALMDLGALVCRAGRPRCDLCPLKNFCRARSPQSLPRKRKRVAVIQKIERHEFRKHGERIVLVSSRRRWRGLWILPHSVTPTGELLHRRVFPFTHHRITLEVRHAFARPLALDERAFSLTELSNIPMPSPHRRAINALLA